MATRLSTRTARLGFETWFIFSAALPALVLAVVWLLSLALPWVPDAYLLNFGTGDAVLLAAFICVGLVVEWEAYTELTNYPGGRMTTWKNLILGVGILEFVAYGACKVFGLYATSSPKILMDVEANLTLIVHGTLATLVIAVLLGVILKLQQIEDAARAATKQARL